MVQDQILTLLKEAKDVPLSGEALGQRLGVSRAAVWKAVEALRQDGYEISSAPRRGYRLERGPDQLRAGEIAGGIQGCRVGRELVCLDSVDSTNTECKRRVMAGAREGLVVVANEQTGGRGRRGRPFLSPRDTGLYLTAVLQPLLQPAQAVCLTAWAAVAVCDAVEDAAGVRPQIKWTNDIILNGKKLCGILTEMEVEAESGQLLYVIPGIGINCNERLSDFPPELRDVATSLAIELGQPVHRAALAAALIRALDRMYADFPGEKSRYLDAYRRDCVTVGRQVRLLWGEESEKAFAEAVDDDFALVVRTPDGTRKTVSAGDVSVRGLEGYV